MAINRWKKSPKSSVGATLQRIITAPLPAKSSEPHVEKSSESHAGDSDEEKKPCW